MECGLTTAHEQAQFRATHDIRRRDDEGKKSSTSQAKFPPDMVFGISTRSVIITLNTCMAVCVCCFRPSTPVFDLLEHRYGERWLEERREAERKQRQKNYKKVSNGIPRHHYVQHSYSMPFVV